MRLRHSILLVTLFALCASPALAREGGETHFRIYGGLLQYSFEEPEGFDISTTRDFTLGGAVGHFLNGWLSIEGEISYSNGSKYSVTQEDFEGSGSAAKWKNPSPDIWLFNGNVNVYMVDATITPYLTGGLGAGTFTKVGSEIVDVRLSSGATVQRQTPEIPSSTDFALNLGAGGDIGPIRIEYRHFFIFQENDTSTVGRLTAGLVLGAY